MNKIHIAYFPYLPFGTQEELVFGDFKLWSFMKKANEYISNDALRENISNRIGIGQGKDCIIFSREKVDFQPFTPSEGNPIYECKLLCFLTFVAQHNVKAQGIVGGQEIATSENFSPVQWVFTESASSSFQQSGYIIRLYSSCKSSEVLFPSLPFVRTLSHIDEPFNKALLSNLLFLKKERKYEYERIMHATGFLFDSYFNTPDLSLDARILLQAAAFETLLDLPESNPREKFKEKIRHYAYQSDDPIDTYKRVRMNKKKKDYEKVPIRIHWADTLYLLRNNIIHGNQTITLSDFQFKEQRHIDISLMFFVLLVKKLLNEKLGKTLFSDEIRYAPFRDGQNREGLGFVYIENGISKTNN